MSYQVLARKWRPQNFKEMVGQDHVLRALVNALDNDKLHHAYLFTGTRGVGKTTIARILAKCLNCETGVTSEPCGECNTCKEIVTGNFVDLIEVDAASRTKVEDTRELLDNVQYAPTRGRYKVYLIDEVHMLTGHSFNALLKTLEEPPPHVKFLFATTDPQKLPVTVLSRCLQFNLKRMPVDMISGHMNTILTAEKIPFDDASLTLIARAADGSMRDGLSLLDQSISFGNNVLKEAEVREMLGTISHEPLLALLKAVSDGDGESILTRVEDLSGVTPDFEAAADAMIALLHQIAVKQVVPKARQDDENITKMAQLLSKEDVQLFYQIALQGRRDLPYSPDIRSGFEMLLLRMMSFRPLREGMKLSSDAEKTQQITEDTAKKKSLSKDKSPAGLAQKTLIKEQGSQANNSHKNDIEKPPPWDVLPEELQNAVSQSTANKSIAVEKPKPVINDTFTSKAVVKPETEWHKIIPQLNLEGRAAELIKHCLLDHQESGIISLTLDKSSEDLLADSTQETVQAALCEYFGNKTQLDIIVAVSTIEHKNGVETPAQRSIRKVEELQQQAEQNIASDPFVIELQNRFGAQIVPRSVKPKNNQSYNDNIGNENV